MREAEYQAQLIKKLKAMFRDCVILKNDANYLQGVPDLLILFRDCWAMLEVKMDLVAPVQPNQEYYINLFDEMSFASFINPEIEEGVLNELQHAFGLIRQTRFS